MAASAGASNRKPELGVMVSPPLVVAVRGLLGKSGLPEEFRESRPHGVWRGHALIPQHVAPRLGSICERPGVQGFAGGGDDRYSGDELAADTTEAVVEATPPNVPDVAAPAQDQEEAGGTSRERRDHHGTRDDPCPPPPAHGDATIAVLASSIEKNPSMRTDTTTSSSVGRSQMLPPGCHGNLPHTGLDGTRRNGTGTVALEKDCKSAPHHGFSFSLPPSSIPVRAVATWLPRKPPLHGSGRNQTERDRDRNPGEGLQVGAASRVFLFLPPSSIPVPPAGNTAILLEFPQQKPAPLPRPRARASF